MTYNQRDQADNNDPSSIRKIVRDTRKCLPANNAIEGEESLHRDNIEDARNSCPIIARSSSEM